METVRQKKQDAKSGNLHRSLPFILLAASCLALSPIDRYKIQYIARSKWQWQVPRLRGLRVMEHSDNGKRMRRPLPFPGHPGHNLHLRLFSRRKKSTRCSANWFLGSKLNQSHKDTRSTKERRSEKADQRL